MNPSKPKRRVGLWIAVAVAALLVAVVAIALKVYFEYASLLETGSAGNLPTSYQAPRATRWPMWRKRMSTICCWP